MITVPADDRKKLLALTNDLIEQCRISMAQRTAYYRLMQTIAATGRPNGVKSLINLLWKHCERTAAHLFSPVELKFSIDFERKHRKVDYDRAAQAATTLTRTWGRKNTDKRFARGVFDSLVYGMVAHKQFAEMAWGNKIVYQDRLVMPWQLGVYNESETDIDAQIAILETNTVTMPEVWRRIWHLPNARELYQRILAHASQSVPVFEPQSYFMQVLSTSILNTGVNQSTQPGGLVQFGMPNYVMSGPQVASPTVNIHELWVKDDDDYTTIIMVEPDVIIAPFAKKENLLGRGAQQQPFRVICPNEMTNWFWGRPEITELIEPQSFLADWTDDTKRIYGLQVDKILGFVGQTGMTDERYGMFRSAGWMNIGDTGSDVKDLTPKVPENGLPMIKFLIEIIGVLGGYPPIMQGQGEPGVRAGSHADKLTKNASPTLRDRALVVERQCADCADLTLAVREMKDDEFYWTDGANPDNAEETKFLLTDLPADWRVVVDSHSTSPIFSDENQQLVFAAHQRGIVDGSYVIDNVPLPNKEAAKVSLKEREERKQKEMQELLQNNPEIGQKVLLKQLTGGKR